MALVGPDAEQYDKRFTWLINGTCQKELLFDNCRWAEGPVWFRDGNFLGMNHRKLNAETCLRRLPHSARSI